MYKYNNRSLSSKPSIILIISSLYSIQYHLRYINYRTFVLKRQY
nr:MAG TPA: hypothetical protein [Caudoviricetes sp.]